MPQTRRKTAAKKKADQNEQLQAERQQTDEQLQAEREQADQQQDEQQDKQQSQEYQPRHPALENAGLDQHEAEKARQAELQEERDAHNRRTGDISR